MRGQVEVDISDEVVGAVDISDGDPTRCKDCCPDDGSVRDPGFPNGGKSAAMCVDLCL